MVSAPSCGHADSEYVIGLVLKCPQFEFIEGQFESHPGAEPIECHTQTQREREYAY